MPLAAMPSARPTAALGLVALGQEAHLLPGGPYSAALVTQADGCVLGDLPVTQFKPLVGETRSLGIVAGEQHGGAPLLAHLPQERKYLAGTDRVEISCGLIS